MGQIVDNDFLAAAVNDLSLEFAAVEVEAEVKLTAIEITAGPILGNAGPARQLMDRCRTSRI